MPNLAPTAGGWVDTEPYRPSLIDFAFAVSIQRAKLASVKAAIPLPQGWSFDFDHKQLLPEPSSTAFAEFRAAFGSDASIHDAESTETDSPYMFTIASKLPPANDRN